MKKVRLSVKYAVQNWVMENVTIASRTSLWMPNFARIVELKMENNLIKKISYAK